MLIGLSYSQCLLDIVQGRVNTDDVLVIVAGTLMDPEDLEEWKKYIWDHYRRTNWRNVADEKTFYDTTMLLWREGKIHQPRKFGGYVTNRHYHWVEACLPIEELKNNPTTKVAFEKLQVLAGLADIKIGPNYL